MGHQKGARQHNLYRVHYSPEVKEEIRELRAYITLKRSRRTADAYLKRLRTCCEGLAIAPHQGETRPELKEGQRTIGFEKRISIVFRIYDDRKLVRITGIRYAGRSLNQLDR